jgi:hypothetical protein
MSTLFSASTRSIMVDFLKQYEFEHRQIFKIKVLEALLWYCTMSRSELRLCKVSF